MKTFAIVLAAFVLLGAAAPMALAQQDASSSSSSATSQAAPSAPADTAPDARVGVDIKAGSDPARDSGGGSASPRTESVTRTTFFGLSPTAAIIVSVAVLLVVILAIVAMTNSRGTTYVDRSDRRL
ncbi:MAG: hypothetical protein FJ027_07705 [Candidatus Rokubacteria bacterium]|nr:hypothetical protein [Candidatus Rokubacteria bacterium]